MMLSFGWLNYENLVPFLLSADLWVLYFWLFLDRLNLNLRLGICFDILDSFID